MRDRTSWAVVGIVAVALLGAACTDHGPSPIFRQDLRSWQFATDSTDVAANYTDINFLTDDLLLVNIATGRGFAPVQPLFSEISSELLLFDVSTGKLLRTGTLPIEEEARSVRATQGGRFVALNQSGVHACSADLTCGGTFPTLGPLLVSPGGARLLVGGNGQSDKEILDSKTLREIDHVPANLGLVGISDTLLLVGGGQILDKSNSKPRQSFFSTDREPQFLSEGNLAGFTDRMDESSNLSSKLVVRRLDGTIMYRIEIEARPYESRLVTSTLGQRFCVDELGYDRWSLPHLLGYGGDGVHYHFERIRIFETTSGTQRFDLKWDPRPYTGGLTSPALSPNGHHVAIVRNGYLEVFNVP